MDVPNVLIFCLILAFLSIFGQCCGPAEIGQQFTISSTVTVLNENYDVKWLLGSITIYESPQENSEESAYPTKYTGRRTSLTILNVVLNDTKVPFQHVVDKATVYNCSLNVYKRASTPTCENMTLIQTEIRTKCSTAEVYLKAKCQFTLQNGGTESRVVNDGTNHITYTHTDPKPNGNEYYSTSCTLQYPVDGLKLGNWTVQVNMYPDLTGVSLAQGTTRQATNTLELSVPTVNIDECPKGLDGEGDTNVRLGYIRQDKRASCLCTRAHAGNPPGTIEWSSTQGGKLVILSPSEDAATIEINSSGDYTCQSTTVLDGCTHSLIYTPEHAYGPSSVSLTFQPPGPLHLCPNQQTNIDITCQVPENSFNPALLFTIRDGRAKNVVNKVAGDTTWSKSVNYNFTTSGQHTFTCRVENAIFNDMYFETVGSPIQVYEPPSDPPKISARSRQHGDILVVGDDVTVTCNVLGGYPSVQSVTLTCGHNQSMTNNGTSSELTLGNIGLSYNETNCTCQATHVTGCYDLMGVLPLTVAISNPTQSKLEDSFPTGAVVGGVVVGLLAIAAVVVGIFFYIRRGKKKNANSSDERVYNNPTHDSTEVDNSDLYSPYEPSPSVTDKDDDHQPTMTSATDLTEKYNPEPRFNLYDEIDPEDLNRDQKLFATKPEAKATTGAKPNRPQVPKPNVKKKAKPKSPETDTKDNVTTEATGGPPLQSANVYEEMELEEQKKGSITISERTEGPAQHSPNDDHEVYLNCPAKNETDSLASNDVIAEGTEGPTQHSPNDEDEVYINYQDKNETDYQNLRMV